MLEKMRGIVGLRIRVTRLEAKFKLSPNRSEPERDNIIIELRRRGDENPTQIAAAMARRR
jgi:predicted FMN-binding regulatory protein PaiB